MVNYLASEELEDKNFGGAMVVLPNGEILSELPIGKEGYFTWTSEQFLLRSATAKYNVNLRFLLLCFPIVLVSYAAQQY